MIFQASPVLADNVDPDGTLIIFKVEKLLDLSAK
jgi:hypothetical protein